jgi:arginine-tRNA-protein transferase
MVYSFYEPKLPELSLGRYMILDHINLAKEMDLPYLYLGYWVKGSKKMDYKSQYSPIEIFTNGKWSLLQSEARDGTTLTVSSQTSEAVSNTIYLPESNPK